MKQQQEETKPKIWDYIFFAIVLIVVAGLIYFWVHSYKTGEGVALTDKEKVTIINKAFGEVNEANFNTLEGYKKEVKEALKKVDKAGTRKIPSNMFKTTKAVQPLKTVLDSYYKKHQYSTLVLLETETLKDAEGYTERFYKDNILAPHDYLIAGGLYYENLKDFKLEPNIPDSTKYVYYDATLSKLYNNKLDETKAEIEKYLANNKDHISKVDYDKLITSLGYLDDQRYFNTIIAKGHIDLFNKNILQVQEHTNLYKYKQDHYHK